MRNLVIMPTEKRTLNLGQVLNPFCGSIHGYNPIFIHENHICTGTICVFHIPVNIFVSSRIRNNGSSQFLRIGNFPPNLRIPTGTAANLLHIKRKFIPIQNYTICHGTVSSRPVSYTHLDVYKRQVLWSECSR